VLVHGTAVDINNDWTLAGECGGRPVKKARDQSPVEALPFDEFRQRKLLRLHSAGCALRPTLNISRIDIERIDIIRCARRFEIECKINRVAMPFEIGDDADRE